MIGLLQQQYFFVVVIFFVLTNGILANNSNGNSNIDNKNSFNIVPMDSLGSDESNVVNQFYPVEPEATCIPLIVENNVCSKYLNYDKIYTSYTQQSQLSAIITATSFFNEITQYGNAECNQEMVFKAICTYLFPQCLTYIEEKKFKEYNLAIRTCYDECYQSIQWCSYSYKFDCNQNLNGYSVPLFPQNSTVYNFEPNGYQNVELECTNPFTSTSSSNDNGNGTSSDNKPTPIPELPNHSALVVYNFNRGKLTKKKLKSLSYNDDEEDHIIYPNGNNNFNIPPGNSIVNEYTPLMDH
ncbi:hypothetical protein DICPUDRAFT_152647 [Dictyostelium purpureum]|uniref:FZ domain-containing protein n=1 Tax=Dictyostelium purpureum TaxID=5786 RepID=F0ZLX8_DICPU|nr:uncharacterized protein DICPUDRAFT_152647 [Dictyostelium purpureum]EGC35064.1 hypothetical protein DICPUDRAFT_152647 [Dictyostelium purpureum]|eukprot:XP_003288432.1 hypothetical protein DICPUDRAFT_152647 [Dictyostelium purpureum]